MLNKHSVNFRLHYNCGLFSWRKDCSSISIAFVTMLDHPRTCVFVRHLNSGPHVLFSLSLFLNVRLVKGSYKLNAERIIDRWPRKLELFWLSPLYSWNSIRRKIIFIRGYSPCILLDDVFLFLFKMWLCLDCRKF